MLNERNTRLTLKDKPEYDEDGLFPEGVRFHGPPVLRWAKARADWVNVAGQANAYVSCNHCDDRLGNGEDTDNYFNVYLVRTAQQDPNVRDDEVIGYIDDPATGEKICVTDYLDDKIGTVKMWTIEESGSPANIPPGWHECDGTNGRMNMQGYFPVGHKAADPDFAPMDMPGGTRLHDHDLKMGATTQPESIRAYHYEEDFIYVDEAKHLPPFRVLCFIQRIN